MFFCHPSAAVFQRLYAQAIKLRGKLEQRRAAVAQEEEDKLNQSKVNMSWISQEMMKDRSHGPFENYGEMLYAEGLEALAKKQSKVIACRVCT
jgi:peroxiredoxin family protein